jgi:hypothetical protein
MPTYTNNIPVPTNPPSADVNNMQANTQAIFAWVPVDHVQFNNPNSGQHNQVTYAMNQTAPALVNGAVGSLYTNLVAGVSCLFFENATTNKQLTNLNVVNSGNGGTAGGSLYTITTPWKITIYGGISNAVVNGTVNFPVPFTTIIAAVASADDPNPRIVSCQNFVGSLNLIADKVCAMSWFAIGIL